MSFRKMFHNTAAMSSVGVLRLLAQFLAIPILARLLSPSDYGLVGLAMPFVLFAMMLADAGIGMSLVRTPSSERVVWSTCFWLSAMLGVVLAAIMAALAPLAAIIFAEPKLEPIVLTLGLVVFSQAICSIPGAALQQSQQFKCIAITEIVAIATGIATAVIVAIKGGGAWALVAQQLAFYAVRVVLTFWFSKFVPLWVFSLQSVKEHLSFGRDVLGINMIGFLARSMDNLVIGKVLSAAAVGIYSMAFQFARIPIMLVTGPLQYVLYAQLAQANSDSRTIRSTFLILTQVLAIVMFPAMGMVAAAYIPIFTWLLSEKWADAGTVFMLLAPACTVQAVTALCSTIMLVLGRTDLRLRNTAEFVTVWILVLLLSVHSGLETLAIMYNVVVILYMPRTLMLTLPLMECTIAMYLRTLMVPSIITVCCVTVYVIIQHTLALPDMGQLVLATLLMVAGIALSAFIQRRAIMQELVLWRKSNAQTNKLGQGE